MSNEPWTLARIDRMVTEKVPEDWKLDYKQAISKTSDVIELTKDVSSFANSDGGVLIYGVSEDRSTQFPLPRKMEPLDFKEITLDWMEGVIDKISPKVSGVKITPVFSDKDNTKGFYVIEVPKTLNVHQAFDCKYYKRGNFKSEPMRHYEVMDVLARRDCTKLRLSVAFVNELEPSVRSWCVFFKVRNIGNVIIRDWRVALMLPEVVMVAGEWLRLSENVVLNEFSDKQISHAVKGVFLESNTERRITISVTGSRIIFPDTCITFKMLLRKSNAAKPAEVNDDVLISAFADSMFPYRCNRSFQDLVCLGKEGDVLTYVDID